MNSSIIKLSGDDWQQYRDLRLFALKSDPHAFGSSYEEEINLEEADWRRRISAMLFAQAGHEVVGLVGLLQRENLASIHCGHIVSLFVKPEWRQRGIANELLKAIQNIAPTRKIRKLSLQVTASQSSALALYKKMGFREVGIMRENLFKDGIYLDEYLMEWLVQ